MKISVKHISLFILILLLSGKILKSQQVPLYSQYMMSKFLLNPAVAGSEGYTSINLTAREQWVGFNEAPKTHALSFQTRLLRGSFISKSSNIKRKRRHSARSGRVGLGGYFYNDKTGIIDRSGMQFTYAYHIYIKESQISMGLSLNSYQFRIKNDELRLFESDDQFLNSNRLSMFIPDANIGVYYSDRKRYFGISADELFQSSISFGNKYGSEYKMLRHYYVMGGHFFTINREFIIEPSLLYKFNEKKVGQIELNTRLYYRNDYWGGFSYRTGAEGGMLIFMGGVKLDKFFIGYAVDYTLSSIRGYNWGTHEFVLAAKFGDNARRYRWLNRY